MASTSYEVEVGTALLEDIDRLKPVPRPTGHELVQIQQTAPGNVRITARNIPGVVCVQRQKMVLSNVKSYDGNGGQEVEREGRFAECSYQQSRTNCRLKCRLKVGKRCKLSMKFTWRLHTVSSQATLTQAEGRGVSIMPYQHKLKGERHASDGTFLDRTVSGVNPGRCKSQQMNIDTHVTHGAKGCTDIGGHCRTKASLTEWGVQSTSANTEQQVPAAGTHSITSGLSSKMHPSCICPTNLVRPSINLSINSG